MFNEINIELTSRCNKHCSFCSRWQNDKPKGDISLELLEKIEPQLDDHIVVHLHNNGEPLLYPHLWRVFEIYKNKITQFDTNGILLIDKAEQIKKANIISVSIVQDDRLAKEQMEIIKEYVKIKPDNQRFLARCVGDIDYERMNEIKKLGLPIIKRVIHDKSGRNSYTKEVIKPEDYICRDFLNHPAIDYLGNFYICVKYDRYGRGIIGNVNIESIKEIWYGSKRHEYLKHHLNGERELVPFCKDCEYYGYPNG